MIILESPRIREWDRYTIQNEPIKAVDLMERAANACVKWLHENGFRGRSFSIYCGKGNNGGDGLAIARILSSLGEKVSVQVLEFGHKGSLEFQENLVRLHTTPVPVTFISEVSSLHPIPSEDVIIDALFGTGIDKPLEGLAAAVAVHINNASGNVVSIDIPSGLYPDRSSLGHTIVKATHTLSFQCLKLAFLMPENAPFMGQVHLLDIGLHPDFPKLFEPHYHFFDESMAAAVYRHRQPFAHKGMQGHAALVVGATGMMGAAILAARACLRSGVGKLTCFIPPEGLEILQVSVPEAICKMREVELNGRKALGETFNAMGIGPGIGTSERSSQLIADLLESYEGRLVLDADALNILGAHPLRIGKWPSKTIITPHIGEWVRLAGKSHDDFERLEQVKAFSREHDCIVVLKGRFTFIASPEGKCYFNGSGNSGLAKAGTGDVLTGIITSYLAQGYAPLEAALLGVYVHGRAADEAIKTISIDSLMASDVIDRLAGLSLP
jgi:NAD(P)H-hydrate epimerase